MKKLSIAGLAGLACLLAMPGAASAAALRSGSQVVIPAGTTINDDLYVAGGQVDLDGHVTGDVIAAGGTLNIRGRVDGNIIAAGGTLRVDGGAGRSMRLIGGNVTAAGPVGKDLLAFAGNLKTVPALQVAGESLVGGGNMLLAGGLGHALRAQAGTLEVEGTVQGPAALIAPSLQVGPDARITGGLKASTTSASPIAPGARVSGEIATTPLDQRLRGDRHVGFGAWLIGFLMALAVGLALLWLVPTVADETSKVAMQAPGWRLAAGLLALVGAPIVAVLMMVTVVGIPLGLLLLVGYGIALYLSSLVVAWSAGRRLFALGHLSLEGYGHRAEALALGLAVVYLLMAVPGIGPLVTFGVILWGLGTLGTIGYERLHERSHPVPAGA